MLLKINKDIIDVFCWLKYVLLATFFIMIAKIINLYCFNTQNKFIICIIDILGTIWLFGLTEFMSKIIEDQKSLKKSIDVYIHNIFYCFILSTSVAWLMVYLINVYRLEEYKGFYAFFYCALSCFYVIYKFIYLYQKISNRVYKICFIFLVKFVISLNILTIVGMYDYAISKDYMKIEAIDTAFSNSSFNGVLTIFENGWKALNNGFEGNGCLLIVLGTIIFGGIDDMLQTSKEK